VPPSSPPDGGDGPDGSDGDGRERWFLVMRYRGWDFAFSVRALVASFAAWIVILGVAAWFVLH
jgi:hypothetical protein